MGAQGERELIEVIRAVRAGDVDAALSALRARRAVSEDPRERRVLDDRMAFTLLAASRWQEAAREYERARDTGGPASVALAVEMIRAYGELGDLERAGEIVSWLCERADAGIEANPRAECSEGEAGSPPRRRASSFESPTTPGARAGPGVFRLAGAPLVSRLRRQGRRRRGVAGGARPAGVDAAGGAPLLDRHSVEVRRRSRPRPSAR
jgi:hypothetical protein